jgi:hypothetical protein
MSHCVGGPVQYVPGFWSHDNDELGSFHASLCRTFCKLCTGVSRPTTTTYSVRLRRGVEEVVEHVLGGTHSVENKAGVDLR